MPARSRSHPSIASPPACNIEPARYRRSPIADNEMSTSGKAERHRVATRSHRGTDSDVDAKPGRCREFGEQRQQDAAGAGAEIENANLIPRADH